MTRHYWFADGGRRSAAIARIGIASSVLIVLVRLSMLPTVEIPGPASLYHPVGPWLAFGHIVPPDVVVVALWVIAWTATVAMLVGIASRISTAVSFVAAVALASLAYASQPTWSHPYNVVFLAQLAFVGARCGDTLSLDALIRKYRRLPPLYASRGYQWSLRLAQLAVAMMFAGAAIDKLAAGHFTLRWALSDNLRHQLLVHYDLAGVPRTALANWLVDDVWRYRIAALLNLASQSIPILACVFIDRPRLRAVCGAVFVIETIALGLVVGLWNWQWVPLVVVFVDWDRNVRFPIASWVPPRFAIRAFIVGFVALDVATSVVPRLDTRLRLYPFSSFPMFASIRAAKPYSEHLPYGVAGDHYEVTADRALETDQQRWFDHHRKMFAVRDPDTLHDRMLALMTIARARYPELGIHAIRDDLTIFEAPAYPAAARLVAHPIAAVAEIRDDGTFTTHLGDDAVQVDYYRDDSAAPVGPEDEPRYVVAELAGRTWLVHMRD